MTKKQFHKCRSCGEEKERTTDNFYFRPGRTPDSPRLTYGVCKPCHKKISTKWKRSNIQRNRDWNNQWRRKGKIEVLAHYGGKCVCCGEKRFEFLSFDHINGGGKKHREELGHAGRDFFLWLRKNNYPDGFRVLCHNCNQARGAFGYCPHERERADNIGGMTFDKVYVDEFETKQRECLLSDKVFKIAS